MKATGEQTRRDALSFLAMGAAASAVSACERRYVFRYRLTMRLANGERARVSSSVVELSIQDQPDWAPTQGGLISKARGEATALDLGGNRLLVALMRANYIDPIGDHVSPTYNVWDPVQVIAKAHGLESRWRDGRNRILEDLLKTAEPKPVAVSFAEMPAVVVADRTDGDVRTRWVSPRDLQAWFGEGPNRLTAEVSLTSDRVEFGQIERQASWLAHLDETDRFNKTAPGHISFGKDAFMRV